MKKRLLLLLLLTLALALAACSEDPPIVPITHDNGIYYLNSNPAAHDAWQALAKEYTAQTGVSMKVESPKNYGEALRTALETGENVPTLFSCADAAEMAAISQHLLDMTNTKILDQLEQDNLALRDGGGAIRAVPTGIRIGGIIVNKALLLMAGYEMEDIRGLADLTAIAQSIDARSEELGFGAFACPTTGDATRLGAMLQAANSAVYHGGSMVPLWTLCIQNPAESAGDPRQDFTDARAVFYIAGDWEYDALIAAGMREKYLSMLPVYCGGEGDEAPGLTVMAENYWAVYGGASKEDTKVTLDFLSWLVTSPEGTAFLAEQFGFTPYQQALPVTNTLTKLAQQAWKNGCDLVPWVIGDPAWTQQLAQALDAYAQDPSDETAAAVDDVLK